MRNGILLVDKPTGPTSHDIVEVFRHALALRQIGHMGTLDPLATGLLLLGVGEGTKLTPFLSGLDKTYECVARLGARSSTYDAMGSIEPVAEPADLTAERIEEALARFRGTIEQSPPPFSAVKVKGRPLYKYARKGEEVERRPRRVRIHAIEILRYVSPDLEIRLRVGSGTYVRSIVHELGERLGVGAHVSRLRRTAIGSFAVAEAVAVAPDGTIEGDWSKGWRRMAEALGHWRHLAVPDALVGAVRNGVAVAAGSLEQRPAGSGSQVSSSRSQVSSSWSQASGSPQPDDLCALVDGGDRLLAVARCLASRGDISVQGGGGGRGELVLKPIRVFHDE